ncbi:hypothetical protein [Leptospira kirschneri]|uniref:hypothetical protein n=1 Tax=Leptospira kirschneri TaxID=29507 RepID=UPI0002BD4036|nr:hypothetical protein LEP1GSC042_3120 [Leptospira kirschneri serovar Bim str. PUO 1247]EPG49673.1 hypothetical protein LEP1GSC049_1089 [Leptospira kirschneri serovar Cynopteri str. 3522 CT]
MHLFRGPYTNIRSFIERYPKLKVMGAELLEIYPELSMDTTMVFVDFWLQGKIRIVI